MRGVVDSAAQVSTHRQSPAPWLGCSPLLVCVYLVFCAALAFTAFHRPLPTYDRFLYAGAVASFRYSDPATLHRIARAEFDAEPSPFNFDSVASEPYFADIYNNPSHFVQQLGLSRVKLGYVTVGYLLWRAGLPILISLRLVSACCLLVVGLVIFLWTRDALLSALLLLTPPVLNMGRMVTGDSFSSAVIVIALFVFAKRKDLLGCCLLVVSVFARSDNFLLVLILLAGLIWTRRLRPSLGAACAAAAVISAVLVNRIAGVFSYRVLMHHSFVKPELEPITHPVTISFAEYLHALAGLRAIPYTFLTIWTLVAIAVWRQLPKKSFFRDLLPVTGIYTVARLVIYPNFDDRVFAWAYLLVGVALIQMAQSRFANREPARQ